MLIVLACSHHLQAQLAKTHAPSPLRCLGQLGAGLRVDWGGVGQAPLGPTSVEHGLVPGRFGASLVSYFIHLQAAKSCLCTHS